jgi:YD repeat-containing protein
VTDPRGNVTQFTYDAADQKTSEIDPRGKQTTFAYDNVGEMTSSTDTLGRRKEFTFDALNRGLRVWIVASGADKAAAVARILADSPESETPAAALSGVVETVVWVDADAASAISG